jgi:hypothetical protein
MTKGFITQHTIEVRNEVDRFGFSYVLAQKFGLPSPPRSFACFSHGWMWRTDLKIEDLGYYFTPKKTPIVVATKNQQEFLIRSGFRNVYAGGLPFAYIEPTNIKRRIESLLVMPPHSMAYSGLANIGEDFLDYIFSIRNEFSEICFCLHADDVNNQEVIDSLQRRNFEYVVGADASDSNALLRMRQIFDYYDFVTTTVMGSHVLYAAYSGCRVSLLKDYHCLYPYNTFDENNIKVIPGCVDRFLDMFNNYGKLESQFPWLLLSHPRSAIQRINWANKEIGEDNLLSKSELMEVLGWSAIAKIKALARIGFQRLIKLYKVFDFFI